MKTKTKDITFTRGDTFTYAVTVKTSITNVTNIFFTVKDENENKVISKKLNEGVTFQGDTILVTIKPVDTNELDVDVEYVYDLQINYGVDDALTPLKGKLKLEEDVTHPADEV